MSSTAQRWGDEIYFSIPVTLEAENQRDVVEAGDLGYWPPGSAFCIFFGHTPASRGDEIRPASPVNVFGKLTGSPEVFKKVKEGSPMKVERLVGADKNCSVNCDIWLKVNTGPSWLCVYLPRRSD